MEFNQYARACAFALLGSVGAVQVAYGAVGASPYKYLDLPNGQRIIVPVSDTRQAAQGQQVWNQATANSATGQVQVGRTGSLPSPAGGSVPTIVKGTLPSPAVAAAVGRVLAVTLKTLGPIGIGVAIYDLAKELGFTIGKSATGESTITKSDPTVCTQAPCPAYQQISGGVTGAIVSSKLGACLDWAPKWSAQHATYTLANVGYDPSQANSCKADVMTKSGALYYANNYYSGLTDVTVSPSPAVNTPATSQELIDAVAAKSGWPAGSKIGEVILQDPEPELQKPVSITTSGPASSPGPVSTTNNTTNNTTTTDTKTYNYQYAGDTITTSVTNVSITTNNSTGAITNNQTTTTTGPTPPEATKPACAEGSQELNCSQLDVPTGEIPKTTKDVSYVAETLFGSGTCPANVTMQQATTGRPIVISYTPTCNALSTYVRPVIIAIALLMAYLIILPGGTNRL